MPSNSAFTLDTAMRFFADEESIATVNRTISQLKSYAKTALGAIGVGISLRELNRMSEEFRSLKNSMNAVFGSSEDLEEVQEKIKETARDVRGEYDKIAENVTTLVKNNRRIFDFDTANRFTDVMYKLTKLSGGNNSEASAAVQSLSAAMRNGKIDRGAIDQLINNVPQAIKVLTSYYGVSQERLRSMAQAGLIRSAQIKEAFLQAGEEIDEAFKDVQMNITDVLASFRSEFMVFIGETDEMLGITKTLAKYLQQGLDLLMKGLEKARSGLNWLADKLGGMENVLKLLAILAASFFIAFHFKDIISGLQNVLGLFTKLGIKGMAVVAVIALIALMIDDLVHFMRGDRSLLGEILDAKGVDTNAVRDKINETIKSIKDGIVGAGRVIRGVFSAIGRVFGGVFKGIKEWWDENGEETMNGLREFFKKFKEDILDAVQAIKDWWDENGDAIVESVTEFTKDLLDLAAVIAQIFGDLWNILVDLLRGDDEQLEADLKSLLDHLGEFLKGLLDMIFGEGFTEDAIKWGENLIDNFVQGIRNAWERVQNFFKSVSNDIKRAFGIEVDEESETTHESESGVTHSGSGGSFGKPEKSRSQGHYEAQRNRDWGTPVKLEAVQETIQNLADADRALRRANAQSASERTASRTTNNDSHNKTTNIEYNQTNNFTGDTTKQRVIKDNMNSATQDFFDQAARAIEFS